MGKVKSIRLNPRTERMFNIIRMYYEKSNPKITDTEIISEGIEKIYQKVSVDINVTFRNRIKEATKKYNSIVSDIFKKTYENLEVICIVNGGIMQDEFWGFFVVNEEAGSYYEVDSSTGERTLMNMQYEKIYDIVYGQYEDKEQFREGMETLYSIFWELYGKEYGRNN